MTTPDDTERPPEAEWVTIPEPPAEHRSEPDISDEDRGRPLGQWVAGGGSVAALGGVGLFQAFGPIGLAAGAVTAAGGAALYGYHRVRQGKPRAFKMGRSRIARTGRSASRFGSLGKGRGKGPKLLGGKGAKLGGGKGGPKLGKGGGPKLGRGGGKLLGGKSGKLLGGKAGKLGGGRSGKLLGGGRGSKLGGKLGRKATSRLGSVGKSGGKLLGRGGKAGLGKGARGGKLLGGKGKAGVGRWGKSTGGGAGILGRGVRKASRKAAAAVGRTRAGRGFKAARSAMTGKTGTGSRWSRFKNASKAARSTMRSSRNPFARWAASVAAALLALTAMGHGRWRAFRSRKNRGKPKSPGYTYWLGGQRPADATNDPSGSQVPPQADHVRHAASERPINTEGKPTMGQSPLTAAAAEFVAAAGRFVPQDMHETRDAIREIPNLPHYWAQGLQAFTKRMQDEYPIHPAVVEQLGEMYTALGRMATMAEQIPATFERVHETENRRADAPRRGEEKWDVGRR